MNRRLLLLVAMVGQRKRPASAMSPSKKRSAATRTTARTESFDALSPASLGSDVEPHTLILGTHPSIASLEKQQTYGHPLNAFWWIAGDCLGFRRDTAISPSTGKPYQLASSLRHDNILPYEEQQRTMVEHGFCIWDVIASCRRPGSLDQDIVDERPNDIRGFCEAHPSIRRIVLANGGTGSALFVKHFRTWLTNGDFCVADNKTSQTSFKLLNKVDTSQARITLVSAISVSPAAAKFKYEEKRDFWEEYVYKPGLLDHVRSKGTAEQAEPVD